MLGINKLDLQTGPIFVNKVVLEHSLAHSFTIMYGCLYTTRVGLRSYDRSYGLQNLKYLLSSPFKKVCQPQFRL